MPSFLRDLIHLYSKIGYQEISPNSEKKTFMMLVWLHAGSYLRMKGQQKMEKQCNPSSRYI